MTTGYHRIVCLTDETTETIYLLGRQDRIAGISGYTVRPPEARLEKPEVSAFTSAKTEKILELKPDLVLGFSDLQASIASDLVGSGLEVHIFNQRSIAGILAMIETVGGFVDAADGAKALAGGKDCFAELAEGRRAKARIIADASEVIRRAPDIIIGSWCGRRFPIDQIKARPGWDAIPAVRNNHVYEIRSSEILQPGPAALTAGLDQLCHIIALWSAAFVALRN